MFVVDVNKNLHSVQVKSIDNTTSDSIVAEGNFAIDEPDHSVLILFNHVSIAADNHEQLSQFLTIVTSTFGELYKPLIRLRLPNAFDNHIDRDKLQFKDNHFNFMSVKSDDLKCFSDDNLTSQHERYELITDKQSISNYAETLFTMMIRDGFWCNEWKLKGMKSRINSATYIAMILDKTNNSPCGFGRIFILKSNEEIFGYLTDIVVDISHQSKGLGRIIVNYLIGVCVNNHDQQQQQQKTHCTLCLECADKGTGIISAPKLYQRSGFDYINNIGNRIAIFVDNRYYVNDEE